MPYEYRLIMLYEYRLIMPYEYRLIISCEYRLIMPCKYRWSRVSGPCKSDCLDMPSDRWPIVDDDDC